MRRSPPGALLVGAFLTAVLAFLALRPVDSNDAWWHLSMGRATLEAGSPVFPEPVALGAAEEYVNVVWLFDLPLYLLYRAGGWTAVSLAIGGLAALCFLASWLLARDVVGRAAPWTALALAVLAAGGAHLRFIPRPQALFLALLPLVTWLARRGASAVEGRSPWLARAGLILAVALWSQSHASAVIAPVVALLASLTWTWSAEHGLEWRPESAPGRAWLGLPRGHWATLAVVALLPLGGPSGIELLTRVLAHRDNFTVRRIAEMQPMSVDLWLVPTRDVLLAEILAVLVLVGLWRGLRRGVPLPLGPLGLAGLGLYLTLESNRFAAAWCLLLLPLVAALWRPRDGEGRRRRLLAGLAVVLVPALLSLGSAAPSFRTTAPRGVVTALRALDVRGPIFNDYDSGAHLGAELYGRVRVIIDSRSQMYFDLEELFAADRALADPRAFVPLQALHDFAAAVVPRAAPLCRALAAAPGWAPAWTGARHAIFLPAAMFPRKAPAEPLVHLPPCAAPPALESCRAAPSAAPFLAELERLLALTPGEAHLGRQLALLALQCARPAAVERAVAGLEAAAAESDHPDFAWLSAQVLLARGAVEPALELLGDLPSSHAPGQLLRLRVLRRLERPAAALPVARQQVELQDEGAAPELREMLAWACEAAGDLSCAVREALRAALAGHPEARDRLAEYRRRGWLPPRLEALASAALGE